jgi:hypothetical protein
MDEGSGSCISCLCYETVEYILIMPSSFHNMHNFQLAFLTKQEVYRLNLTKYRHAKQSLLLLKYCRNMDRIPLHLTSK